MNKIRCIVCGETAGFLEHKPSVPVFCSMHCDRISKERGMNIKISIILDQPKPFVDHRSRIPDPSGEGWLEAPPDSYYVWIPGKEVAPGFRFGEFSLCIPVDP